MHRAGDLFGAQQGDQPLDLAPTAEVDEIADVAAAPGALRRLGRGMLAEGRDEFRRVGKGRAVGEMNLLLQIEPPAVRFVVRPAL